MGRLFFLLCASDIPTELENQLKSGAMKISLQSKPKTYPGLPGLIMNKIPGPTIDPSKSIIQGQVLGKISKTVTLKYDSNDKVTKRTPSGATKGNIDAFKQFRDIDVQLLTGPKKNNNTSLSGCGIKRKGDFIAQQDVKFSKLSSPVSAGAQLSSSDKTPPGPGTNATNFVIPKTLLNSKDVVCKIVRKTDASVRVNIESNKNIEIKKNQIVVPKTPESNKNVITKIPTVGQNKSPQNHRLHLERASNLNKVTVGSVKISTKTLQNSNPPSSILDLKLDSRQKIKRIVNEPSMPRSKIPKIEEPLPNSKVTAHQVNMGKSFSRFVLRNQQAENHQKPRFRKFYPKLNLSCQPQESDPCHKINTDVENKKSLNNFDRECPEQCGEKFSNVGDLVTHYQEAHEAPNSTDQSRDEQIETQQSVDDFEEALSRPFLIDEKNEEKTKTNVEEKSLSVKAAVINLSPLLGTRWRPLLPMLEYFPTANLESGENPVKDDCQDITVIIKQEILDYDENDDTEVCEVFSDNEDEFADKFDDFAESLAESYGAADLINTNSCKKLSLIEETEKELYRDSSDVIEIIDEPDGTQRKLEEILQLDDVDNEEFNKECKIPTQPNIARKPSSVNIKHIFDEDVMKIRNIQRVKLVYLNDSNMAHVQDLDLCLVVNKSIAKITTVLDEDIGDGIIFDYNVVTESFKVAKKASPLDLVVVPPPEIISLSDDDEVEILPSSMGYGQFNRRSQEDYDSDEEYDRMNFGVPDHEDKFNKAQLEDNKTTDVITERTENEYKIDPSEFSNKEKSKDALSNLRNQIETRNCEVKLKRLNKISLVKACFVRVENISVPEESPYAEDSDDDLDEDFEDELDRVFAEIEALERKHVEGETKLEMNDLAISDILDSLIGDVMGQVVEPWSEYVTVKRVEGKAEKIQDIAPSQLESGWDKMEITSQPAESVTQLNYYFTC